MTRGACPCRFRSLRSRRLAAFASRRLWTRTSSTTPCWSTARHSQCVFPAILTATSSRCHLSPAHGSRRRISFAKGWPNLSAHCRTVSLLAAMPPAARISSTIHRPNGQPKSSPTALLLIAAQPAFAEAVDLRLVVDADVSGSGDQQEYEFQRQGYAAAVNDPRVWDAIQSGRHKAIALCFIEWSGAPEQRVVVDWTIISDREIAAEFAGKLLAAPRSFSGSTAIGAAIDFAARQRTCSGIETARRAVDVSGDGPSNQGRSATAPR